MLCLPQLNICLHLSSLFQELRKNRCLWSFWNQEYICFQNGPFCFYIKLTVILYSFVGIFFFPSREWLRGELHATYLNIAFFRVVRFSFKLALPWSYVHILKIEWLIWSKNFPFRSKLVKAQLSDVSQRFPSAFLFHPMVLNVLICSENGLAYNCELFWGVPFHSWLPLNWKTQHSSSLL